MINIAPNTPLVYVSFSAEIIPNTTEALIGIMVECANKNVQKVNLLISSPGGAVMNGFNLYNVLKGMPFELTTHNVGNVDSIGNVIFLSGKIRYACPNATFMFHGAGFNSRPNERLEQKNLEEKLNNLLSDQKRIGHVIVQHSTLKAKQVSLLFKQAVTKNAEYALNSGIIHEIRDVNIPTGCPVVSLIFQRQSVQV